eukprot:329501-Chlamydomonas_euryale.AAC.2
MGARGGELGSIELAKDERVMRGHKGIKRQARAARSKRGHQEAKEGSKRHYRAARGKTGQKRGRCGCAAAAHSRCTE